MEQDNKLYTIANMQDMSFTKKVQEIAMNITPYELACAFLREKSDAENLREELVSAQKQLFWESKDEIVYATHLIK